MSKYHQKHGKCISCGSHGLCDDGVLGSGKCKCSSGWTSVNCSVECPGGKLNICSGHGLCGSKNIRLPKLLMEIVCVMTILRMIFVEAVSQDGVALIVIFHVLLAIMERFVLIQVLAYTIF